MAIASVVNRRDFLKTGAAGGVALVIGFHLSPNAFADQAEEQEKKTPNPFDAWVRITPDNRVTLILSKSEMGQGIMTALPMILAEELCVEWKQVKVQQAPTNPKIYDLGTGGSGSVAGSWLPLRRAGAAAREMLVAAAAKPWVVSPDTCKAQAVPGVRDVIQFETSGRGASTTGGVAVLADNSWAAIQGRNALEVKWEEGPAAKESTAGLQKQFLANAAKPGRVLRNEGDADSALGSSPKKVEAVYELPFAPHAC